MAVGLGPLSTLHPVPGFELGIASAGIKRPGRKDVVVMRCAEGSSVAGVFTLNAFCAAPVTLAKQRFLGEVRYLLTNTGNANAGTGGGPRPAPPPTPRPRPPPRGGPDAVSLINTINSITSVDLERMVALPVVGTQSTHGGYCGSAVKPIALNMVAEIARDPQTRGLPICGIGGIGSWRDAAEFVALGCGAVQVCTAAMLHGFRIVEDMQDGLARWMDSHGYQRLSDFSGGAVGNTTDWKYLDINYQVIARIDQDACIGCGRCHIACEDTSHQAIASLPRADGTHRYEVIDAECVGCNLCQITCPVENCIEMVPQDTGKPYLNWTQDPRNPYREAS